jgi:hypothetical protein
MPDPLLELDDVDDVDPVELDVVVCPPAPPCPLLELLDVDVVCVPPCPLLDVVGAPPCPFPPSPPDELEFVAPPVFVPPVVVKTPSVSAPQAGSMHADRASNPPTMTTDAKEVCVRDFMQRLRVTRSKNAMSRMDNLK